MANGTIRTGSKIKTKTITVTCGTNQYSGFFYGDYDIAAEPFTPSTIIGTIITGVTDGHFASVEFPFSASSLSDGIRVYSSRSGAIVTIQVSYLA